MTYDWPQVTAQVTAQVGEQVSKQVGEQVAGQVTARFSTAKNTENTKMKKRGHRSAAFTPLQRAGDLGEMMSADVRTVKRTEVRAPVPFSAFFAFSVVKSPGS